MKAYVNTKNNETLNLRANPNTSAKVLARIPHGTELEVDTAADGWYRTFYNEQMGYVMSKFLAATTTQISKQDLQNIFNSLQSTLKIIEEVLK